MKTIQHEVSLVQIPEPVERQRISSAEQRSAAHRSDPRQQWQHPAATPDFRERVEFAGAPQRVRARQNEPRTGEDCHVRRPRRPRESE